jgi:lipopolysaccharide transport system ATP-binding protein
MGTITVSNLGKAYKQYPNRWSRLAEWLTPGFKKRHHLKWVLQDISFGVKQGEALGIIGINGAGKSTLLKMITGTTRPTTGGVSIQGRVAALLELGMGFHPDFTGRQNAYMAGQLLGYTVEEIAHLMPEIEAFAEIGDYIDEPVRVYSSGMQMRLAFSVATAQRPDVLIVDEAMSVGDAYFQHKSFDRIRAFRKQGTTLLLVSHDKAAIQSICDRAILLNAGRIATEGPPEAVMDYYNAMLAERANNSIRQVATASGRVQTTSGAGGATVIGVAILNENGENIDIIEVGSLITLSVRVRVDQAIPFLVLGYLIKDKLGQSIFGTNTQLLESPLTGLSESEIILHEFTFTASLGVGSYSIAIALTTSGTKQQSNFEWRDLALVFDVVNTKHGQFVGCNWLPPTINIALNQ